METLGLREIIKMINSLLMADLILEDTLICLMAGKMNSSAGVLNSGLEKCKGQRIFQCFYCTLN